MRTMNLAMGADSSRVVRRFPLEPRRPVPQKPTSQQSDNPWGRPPSPVMLSVARQPDTKIVRMDRSDLIDLIRGADLPPVNEETMERLDWLDRADLERLAFLTRRCCRNQINSYYQHLGRPALFIADV